jgi:hypothetical protein
VASLFIFIKTISLSLEECEDPMGFLEVTLDGSDSTGLTSLYELYSHIVRVRIVHSYVKFQCVIGVLLTTAPFCPLSEEAIGLLAGIECWLIHKWVGDLNSFLYQDGGANGGIQVQHLSISDFFVSDGCPEDYQVNLQDENMQMGIACLETMADQLCFNICKLEDSRRANADVEDLPARIKKNISEALQYSSLYWSNHVCFTPDDGTAHMGELLEKFFEGLCGLFWIEVQSIMGTVPTGAPRLEGLLSWVKVNTIFIGFHLGWMLIYCSLLITCSLRESKIFYIS